MRDGDTESRQDWKNDSISVDVDQTEISPESLRRYLAGCGLVRDADGLRIRALGGGVSNIVLLIEGGAIRWVAKQSLGKLRVKDDWRSDRGRIFREADAIRALRPVLGGGAAPELVHVDRQSFFFIMTAAPEGSRVWKDLLLQGEVDLGVAKSAGRLLARMIVSSRADPSFRECFADRTVFDQLRIDPYYRTTALRAPDVRSAIEDLIYDSWQVRTSLVHGDYSPKNMLFSREEIFLVDFEGAHWGDPAFDAAFLINHLLLKALHRPRSRESYLRAGRACWEELARGIGPAANEDFEEMTVRHLGGLMRARIDGKSPAEYIRDERTKDTARRASRQILLETRRLEQAFALAGVAAAQLS